MNTQGRWRAVARILVLSAATIVLTRCGPAPAPDELETHPTLITACHQGASPIDVVLAHFAQRDDLWLFGGEGNIGVLTSSVGPQGIRVLGGYEEGRSVDVARLMEVFIANNRTVHVVSHNLLVDGVIPDTSARPIQSNTFGDAPPEDHFVDSLRGRLQFWIPAVSAAEDNALVAFQFGPSPHGACGTYYLGRCENGAWTVLWSDLSYHL